MRAFARDYPGPAPRTLYRAPYTIYHLHPVPRTPYPVGLSLEITQATDSLTEMLEAFTCPERCASYQILEIASGLISLRSHLISYLRDRILLWSVGIISPLRSLRLRLIVVAPRSTHALYVFMLAPRPTHAIYVCRLDKDNKLKCSGCKQMTRASKQLSLYRAPNILCVHLKRFRPGTIPSLVMCGHAIYCCLPVWLPVLIDLARSHAAGFQGKVSKPIKFDEQLSLKHFMTAGSPDIDPQYELLAVLVSAPMQLTRTTCLICPPRLPRWALNLMWSSNIGSREALYTASTPSRAGQGPRSQGLGRRTW